MFDFISGFIGDASRFVLTFFLVFITIVVVIALPSKTKIWGLLLMVAVILFVWFYSDIMSFIADIIGLV